MTMPNAFHPDDERLAAFADREADAVGDRALTDHLAGCDRCRLLVDDLGALRSVLADLPDIVPSRPLRLLPPVPEPAPRVAGRVGWLRRLTAPVFAAGTVLVLVGAVGAVGASGVFATLTGMASTAEPDNYPAAESATERASDSQYAVQSPSAEPLGPSSEGAGGKSDSEGFDIQRAAVEVPWVVVLAVGIGLLAAAAVMRFSLQPHAG